MTKRFDNCRISPEVYGREYFLSNAVEGYSEYKNGQLSATKSKQLHLLELQQDTAVLEVGYGRGELLLHCAQQGAVVAGIDYSKAAHRIASETLAQCDEADIRIAECTAIPYEDSSFDRVFSGDVIEHVSPADAVTMLREMKRVVKPGGFLLVHTTPNTVFTKMVYPLLRPLLRRMHESTIEAVDRHLRGASLYHVKEYNFFSIRQLALKAGLNHARVWIDPDVMRSGTHVYTAALARKKLIKYMVPCARLGFVRCFLGNDIYVKWTK